jgi:hypothetical protein
MQDLPTYNAVRIMNWIIVLCQAFSRKRSNFHWFARAGANRIESLLRQRSASGKDLAPQIHILDGIKLMDFSSLTAQEHISKEVRDELKRGTMKNVAIIVRFG